MTKHFKLGAVLSYLSIVLNMVISLFFTPFLIKSLGDSEYGVYKVVQSFSGHLAIMSFGVATLIVRNLVFFSETERREEKENFLFFALVATYSLATLIIVVGMGMFFLIDPIYSSAFTGSELSLAKKLFILLVVNTAVSVIGDSYSGIINAHEKFAISNGLRLTKIVLRVVVMSVLLIMGRGAFEIVLGDLFTSVIIWLVALLYGKLVLKEKAKFHKFDKALLVQCFTFSFAIFGQVIISQVNQNLDNVILGAFMGTSVVTMYSLALSLFMSFSSFVTAIGSLFTPTATKLIANDANEDEITAFVVKPGRFQLLLSGLAICGFALFGRNFIKIWVGEEYMQAYFITLILIVPASISLIESVTNSVLDAMLKRLGRTLILLAMCVVNVTVSVLLIQVIGFWGAAVGTAVSFIIGEFILHNVYIQKVTKISVPKLFKGVFSKLIISIPLSAAIGFPLTFLPDTTLFFFVKVVAFTVIYVVVNYFIGLKQEEKEVVKGLFKKKRQSAV